MEDFEDIQELFKVKKMSNIKFIVNIIGLLGAIGGGWYKLESRVSALEQEIEKRYYSNGIGDINNPSNKTFQKLYKATFDNLYIKFCIDTSVTKTKMFYFNDYIKFTYWLFKYRINISDGAKIASDTQKALRHIVIKPQSCFAPVLFQLG